MTLHNKLSYTLMALLLLVGVSIGVWADNNVYQNVNHQGKSIYNIANVNASFFYGDGSGITGISGSGNASTGICTGSTVAQNITGTGPQCVAVATANGYVSADNGNFSLLVTAMSNNDSAIRTSITANNTDAKAFSMAQYNGNNSAWLSTANSSYPLQADIATNNTKQFLNVTGNLTIRGLLNVTNITMGQGAFIWYNGSAICIGAC